MVVQRVAGVFAGLMLVMVIAAPMAPGQVLGRETETLWAHASNDGGCCTYFASTVKDEGTTGVVGATLVVPEACVPGVACFARTWTMPVTGGFTAPVDLDPEGFVKFQVYTSDFRVLAGMPAGTNAGVVDIWAELLYDGSPVATTDTQQWISQPASGIELFEWEVTPVITRLEPGKELTFVVYFDGHGVLLGMSFAEPGPTNVALPIATKDDSAPATAQTIQETLEGDAAEILQSFDEPTNDTYIFNWTTDASMVDIAYNATVENGSVDLTFLDGNGTEVLLANLTSSLNASEAFEGVAAGNWSIEVRYAGFTGSLRLDIVPQQEDDGETIGGGEGDNEQHETDGDDGALADGDDGGDTSAATEERSKGLPGPAPALILVALALVAALRRR